MNKKILLIDDSKTQLNTLKIMFKRAGYDVETACDGLDGYKKIFETTPDIIISDIMMPNLNGYQLCRLIKDNQLTKDIPIILLTNLEQKIDKFWSKQSGADQFIKKTTDIGEIISSADNLVSKHAVTETIKEKLQNYKYTQVSVQQELNDILDNSLMRASILNEFRRIAIHIEENTTVAENLFELLSSILNFDLAFWVMTPVEDANKEIFSSRIIDIKNPAVKNIIKNFVVRVFGKYGDVKYKNKDIDTKPLPIDEKALESLYIHPIKHLGKPIGGICFCCSKDKDIEHQKLFHIVLKEIELITTIQTLYLQNKFLSLTDGLTGIFNRRYLIETLDREYSRSLRYNSKLSVVMLDIDYFKNVNDTYGHLAGDFILKELTQLLKQSLRKSDITFRYGGEEILIIMPETDKERAKIPLERIRNLVESKSFKFGTADINITVSIGISDSTQEFQSLEEFISHADKALYNAKQSGRNRIKLYNE